MKAPARSHPLWLAYILHRLSGLLLALFLFLHFWVLSKAITNPKRLDGFQMMTESGVIKVAEFGLVFLLAVKGLIASKDHSALAGVLMIDMRTGKFRLVRAKTVLIAAGGGPSMYKYHTPSGDKTMDGLAMAWRAGLALRDLEMV